MVGKLGFSNVKYGANLSQPTLLHRRLPQAGFYCPERPRAQHFENDRRHRHSEWDSPDPTPASFNLEHRHHRSCMEPPILRMKPLNMRFTACCRKPSVRRLADQAGRLHEDGSRQQRRTTGGTCVGHRNIPRIEILHRTSATCADEIQRAHTELDNPAPSPAHYRISSVVQRRPRRDSRSRPSRKIKQRSATTVLGIFGKKKQAKTAAIATPK